MSAEHSRSAESAGVLKIDCLPNDPAPGPLQICTGRTEVRAPNCVSRMEEQRCCTENTALCSRRTVKDFAATCRLPVTATTDFVARDILNRCGRRTLGTGARSTSKCSSCARASARTARAPARHTAGRQRCKDCFSAGRRAAGGHPRTSGRSRRIARGRAQECKVRTRARIS